MEEKKGSTRVSILLTILGEIWQKIYNNIDFDKEEKKSNIKEVLLRFDTYVGPRVNTIYEICMFYRREQNQYETFEKFVNGIKTLSEKCDFENITVDEM